MNPSLPALVTLLAVATISPAQGSPTGTVPRIFGWSHEGTGSGARLGSAITVVERTSLGVPLVVSVEKAIDTARFLDIRHGAEVVRVRGAGRSNFGRCVTSGDYDGDGIDEVAISSDTGVAVYDDTARFLWYHPSPPNSGVIRAMVTLDLDQDGHDDIVLGHPFADTPQASGAGRVDVLSGRTRNVSLTASGTYTFGSLGFKLAAGVWNGGPVCYVSEPNATNLNGGTGFVYGLDATLSPVFTYGPAGDRRAGSGFLAQHGNLLAIGSSSASRTASSNEGNISIVDLTTGVAQHDYYGTVPRQYLGATGAFDPTGTLYFTATGTQNQGEFFEWDHTTSSVPTMLFQGDIGTGVSMHGEIYSDLLGDGLPVGVLGQPGASNLAGRPQAGRVATLLFGAQTMYPDLYRIPSGGSADLDVAFGVGAAGRAAAVLASLSGSRLTPLAFAPGRSIALTFDWLTPYSTDLMPGPTTLDTNGDGTIRLQIPADPTIRPLDLSVAAIAFDPSAPLVNFLSSEDAHTLRVFH